MPGVTITPAHIGLLMAFISIAGIIGTGAIAYSTIRRLEKNDDDKQRRLSRLEHWASKQGFDWED